MVPSSPSTASKTLSALGPLPWVVGATFLHFASLHCLSATLPLYVVDLGGSTFQVGLIVGVFSLSSLGARPFVGAWMDRAGRQPFLIAGAAIYIVASLGYLAIQAVPPLLAWRVFHAMGLASFGTGAASLMGDLAPPRRLGATMGLYGLAQAGALAVAPGAGAAIHRTWGYPGLFLAAASAALAALACTLLVRETPLPPKASDGAGGRPPRAPVFRAVGPPAALQFSASIAYGTVVSFIAVVARHRRLDVAGIYFALLALSSLSVRLVAGRAYDALGPRAVLVPAFLALAVAMGLLAIATRSGIFLCTAVLAGAGIGATHTALLARVVERSPSQARGSAVAVFTSCWELGVGGGAIPVGRLAEAAGFAGMYLAVAAIAAVGLLGLRWLGEGQRPGS